MIKELKTALRLLAVMTVLTGALYPALVTGLAQLLLPQAANGSLVQVDGRDVGSALIGQPFAAAGHFWGRPSATAPMPYNAAASSGSNLGPLHPALAEAVAARIQALKEASPERLDPIPVDLVTASASGLDPHLSPAAAEWQVTRVARSRGLSEQAVRALVASHTEGRTFGLLGEARVNVLTLNLALERLDRR